jgi:phage baseplate assembly protein W
MQPLPPLTPEKALLRVLGSGPSFPFTFATTGNIRAVALAQGLLKINQSIHAILSTRPGERMFLPEFGCFAKGTAILTLSGCEVPIEDLVGQVGVYSFGAVYRPAADHQPAGLDLVPASFAGAVSRGVKKTCDVTFSNGAKVRCTPDHPFLASLVGVSEVIYTTPHDENLQNSSSIGSRLAWVDTSVPDLGARITAWKQMRRDATLCQLPMSSGKLRITSVEPAGEEECFDLLNSSTENYALGAGPIVSNSRLPELVFEPDDVILEAKLRVWTADALKRWEKRITVTAVDFLDVSQFGVAQAEQLGLSPQVLAAARDMTVVGISITYTINRTYMQGSYVYPFVLGGMPMKDTVTGNPIFQGSRV